MKKEYEPNDCRICTKKDLLNDNSIKGLRICKKCEEDITKTIKEVE